MSARKHKRSIASRALHLARNPWNKAWTPIGYYNNRPAIARRLTANGFGTVESFRFTLSPHKD